MSQCHGRATRLRCAGCTWRWGRSCGRRSPDSAKTKSVYVKKNVGSNEALSQDSLFNIQVDVCPPNLKLWRRPWSPAGGSKDRVATTTSSCTTPVSSPAKRGVPVPGRATLLRCAGCTWRWGRRCGRHSHDSAKTKSVYVKNVWSNASLTQNSLLKIHSSWHLPP